MRRCIVAVVGGRIEFKLRGRGRIREILSLHDPVYKNVDIWAPKKAIPLWMKYQSDKKKKYIIFFFFSKYSEMCLRVYNLHLLGSSDSLWQRPPALHSVCAHHRLRERFN